jgi:hypothetical protein
LDDRYRSYYARLFEAAADWPGVLPAVDRPAYFDDARELHHAILDISHAVEQRSGISIREDAQLFVFLNSWQMLLRPILSVHPDQRDEVLDDVRVDIEHLLEEAARDTSGGTEGIDARPPDQVSGHRVIMTLNRLWKELRLTRWEVWEG